MKKKKSIKQYLLLLVAALLIVFLGIILTILQTDFRTYNQWMRQSPFSISLDIHELVQEAHLSEQISTMEYDSTYISRARTAAYMAKNDVDFMYTDSYMSKLASLLHVHNVLIVNRDGEIVAQAKPTPADFSINRFNELENVYNASNYAKPFTVEWEGWWDPGYRYFASSIDGLYRVIIEETPYELRRIQSNCSSWESMLSNIRIGRTGYAFVVSSKDYTILYHPKDVELHGQDAIGMGINVECFEHGYNNWLTLDGERLLCYTIGVDSRDAYVVCVIPEEEILQYRHLVVGIVLFVFAAVIAVVLAYAFFVLKEQEKDGENQELSSLPCGFQYNKNLGRRLGIITFIGVLTVFVVCFYMQTLSALSLYSISNMKEMEDLKETFAKNEKEAEWLTQQFSQYTYNECQIAADILEDNPQLYTREDLSELAETLSVHIEDIYLFDRNGRQIVSSTSEVGCQISKNPKDLSYEFNKVITGAEEYLMQVPVWDEDTEQYYHYIGWTIHDEEGLANGFVRIRVLTQDLEEALEATTLPYVLNRVGNGIAFAVDKDTKNFLWFPREEMIGKNALTYGVNQYAFRDGFAGNIRLDGVNYYAYGIEREHDYLYVAVPEAEIHEMRLPVTIFSTLISALFLGILFLLLTITRKKPQEETAVTSTGPMIDVEMPDGSVRKTDSAASRWANRSIKWDERTAEQQVATLLKGLMSVFAIFICIGVLFKDRFFESDSIFQYIINGQWNRGVNVFALTGCLMIICVFSVGIMFVREILRMLSKVLDARGETICRMLRSFVKYFAYIAMLYYCFALFGVDTRTLLASAGVLSLVIGLGAKELVSDILAGIFIIFEGEFRVGDIVTVGDWRGTVQEIGVRTTKIMDPGQNVKIINNSSVSGVINMTRKNSYTFCDVGIEYGESLERMAEYSCKRTSPD